LGRSSSDSTGIGNSLDSYRHAPACLDLKRTLPPSGPPLNLGDPDVLTELSSLPEGSEVGVALQQPKPVLKSSACVEVLHKDTRSQEASGKQSQVVEERPPHATWCGHLLGPIGRLPVMAVGPGQIFLFTPST
jgi:hypothetical protein